MQQASQHPLFINYILWNIITGKEKIQTLQLDELTKVADKKPGHVHLEGEKHNHEHNHDDDHDHEHGGGENASWKSHWDLLLAFFTHSHR